MQSDYWQEKASSFASKYGKNGIVSRFLEDRTVRLLRLLDLNPEISVLDAGCGSGEHMVLLRDEVKYIAGADISATMLELADQKLRYGKQNWELCKCSAEDIPQPDKAFDLIIAMGLLDYIDSVEDVLREFARLLKDGGKIVVTIPKSPSLFSPLRSSPGNWIKRVVFDLPPVQNVLKLAELMALFDACGFKVEHTEAIWTAMWMIKAGKSSEQASDA